MTITLCEKFIQITILGDDPFLPKALKYAKKHFAHAHHLSSSVLILDDGERFKKDYLLNWAYYTSMAQDASDPKADMDDLSNLLDYTFLPIRIKMLASNAMLVRVRLSLRLLNLKTIIIRLDKDNATIKRYLAKIFRAEWIGAQKCEVFLSAKSPSVWEKLTLLTSFKVIYNVMLDFDMDSFLSAGGAGKFESFMTAEERALSRAYMVLESSGVESFEAVKKNYLRLVKEYHPDNVYGGDPELVSQYHDQFLKIQEAYEVVKKFNLRQAG